MLVFCAGAQAQVLGSGGDWKFQGLSERVGGHARAGSSALIFKPPILVLQKWKTSEEGHTQHTCAWHRLSSGHVISCIAFHFGKFQT
jgi:hypothetical protein